jgi:hypothetical protein
MFSESLETRRLMAVSVISTTSGFDFTTIPETPSVGVVLPAFADLTHRGTLVIHGTAAADSFDVSHFNGQIVIRSGKETAKIADTLVKRLLIEGGGGDDYIKEATDFHATLAGQSGNDVLVAGRGDVLVGGAGNDKLFAGIFGNPITIEDLTSQDGLNTGEQSELHGGAGRDRLYAFGGDIVDGAGGNDQAFLYQIFVGASLIDLPPDQSAFVQDQFDDRATSIEAFGLERALFKTTTNADGTTVTFGPI